MIFFSGSWLPVRFCERGSSCRGSPRDVRMVCQAVQKRDNAGGIGEDLVPLFEGSGSNENGTLFVAAIDNLTAQVTGVAVPGQMLGFINAEE